MKRDVKTSAWARAVARAAFAAMGLWAARAAGGDLKVGVNIRIGEPPPPPPPVVVVEERPAVVVVDDGWIVGPRRRLYDADLRLRLAQSAEYRASEELEAARRHEGDVALALDDNERLMVELRHEVGEREAGIGSAR